ncbi:MAG: hypothetical protein AAF368_03505 [Planctomycetota bacterium]
MQLILLGAVLLGLFNIAYRFQQMKRDIAALQQRLHALESKNR